MKPSSLSVKATSEGVFGKFSVWHEPTHTLPMLVFQDCGDHFVRVAAFRTFEDAWTWAHTKNARGRTARMLPPIVRDPIVFEDDDVPEKPIDPSQTPRVDE